MQALFEGIPLARMNTSMTINATAPWLLALYIAAAERQGAARKDARRHGAERHRQGVPLARHLHLPARPEPAAHRRRHRLRLSRRAEVESDQRLLLSPAGGRRDAGAGAGLHARHRDRRDRCRQGHRPGAAGRVAAGDRPHLLLRQCRHPLHRRDLQDARLHRAVGRALPRALERRGREAPPLPLRRAGEFPRPHRAAAGEQRLSHPAGDAGRRAVEGRPRARRAAAGLERGAGPAAALGPAMVDPPAADRRRGDRPARLRRHLRRLARHRRQGRRSERRGAGRAGAHRGHGRRHSRRRVRLHEGAAGRIQRAPRRRHRDRAS